jgi:hypothetical protein
MARTAKLPRTVRPQHIAGCSVRFRPYGGILPDDRAGRTPPRRNRPPI